MNTEEQFYTTDRAQLFRWMPWLHLLRTFRVALGVRKLFLGAAAAVLLVLGQWAIDEGVPEDIRMSAVAWPWDEPRLPLENGLEQPGSTLLNAAGHATVLLRPFHSVIDPARLLLQLDNSWSAAAYAWTHLLWALAVWALFGTAISRMAALDFTGNGHPGVRDSLQYSLDHIRSTFAAPLIPIGFVGVLWLICCVGGLAGRIPYVGEFLVGLLWFIPLLFGVAAAVIILCVVASWPLMICTVSVERSDAFDGLSRAYDYLASRPWYALWLAGLSLATGAVAILLVSLIVQLASHFGTWSVGSGMGDEAALEMTSAGPDSFTSTSEELTLTLEEPLPPKPWLGPGLVAMWLQALALLEWGFVYSFFWSAMTMIYLLLRKSVDATSIEEVSLPEESDPDALPLSGVAAAERGAGGSSEPDSEPERPS